MSEDTLTDASYKLIERIERKRRGLKIIIAVCSIIAPLGLVIDALVFTVQSHQKGGLLDTQIILIAITFIVFVLVLVYAFNEYSILQRSKKELAQLEILEKTIYEEVLKSQTD